jgi:hypothetical protein
MKLGMFLGMLIIHYCYASKVEFIETLILHLLSEIMV